MQDGRPPTPPIVVCFGDSLTAGFQSASGDNPEGRSTPYGDWLQERLGSAARVLVRGVCGEVTGEMVMRFRRDVLDHRPRVVIILGGTNDLGWNAAPQGIMRNLVKLYEQTLAAEAVPVPVTVPSIRVEDPSAEGAAWVADHVTRRRELNELIRTYAVSKRLPCIDLFNATADPTGQLAARYSNDGLHLTTLGYRLLAEEAAQAIGARLDMAPSSNPS